MEYLTLLVTLILFGVFVFVIGGGHLPAGRAGGPVLVRVARPRGRRARISAAVFGVLLAGLYAVLMMRMIDLGGSVLVMVILGVNLLIVAIQFVSARRFKSVPFDIHQRGIVTYFGVFASFTAWDRVRYCKWRATPGRLFVQLSDRIVDYIVPPEQIDEVTAALTGLVEVRDRAGEVIAPAPGRSPGPAAGSEAEDAPRLRRFAFQFRLRTLLLLVILLSAGSAWVGTLVHRARKRQAAVAPLERFEPCVKYEGADVVDLFFLQASELGDDDLPAVARSKRLRRLNLAATQVTDAGLEHLAGLRELRHLDLKYTRVTPQGVERLRQVLPETKIEY